MRVQIQAYPIIFKLTPSPWTTNIFMILPEFFAFYFVTVEI